MHFRCDLCVLILSCSVCDQVIINSTITPNMTFTKTSQKFGQWADSRANTVFGLGFPSEQQLTKVTGLAGLLQRLPCFLWVQACTSPARVFVQVLASSASRSSPGIARCLWVAGSAAGGRARGARADVRLAGKTASVLTPDPSPRVWY